MPCSRSPGGLVSQHALQVSRPTPSGEVEGSGLGRGISRPTSRGEVEGSAQGGSPGPHWRVGGLQAHTWGESPSHTQRGVSQHALRQTPPPRRLLLRAVRILLECILVEEFFPHFRDFVNNRLLVHKHVKISVDEWILETTCPHKPVTIFGIYFTVRNSSCGKVMFSQVSVILSMGGCGIGGMHGKGGCVWQRGACMAKGGMCGKGEHVG